MQTLSYLRIAQLLLVMLILTVGSGALFAADVCEKKPELPKCDTDPDPDPPPDPDDPCAGFADPDVVFWRDATSKRVPAVTIFLAESATGCEKELLRIDLSDTGPINDLHLAYSSIGTGDEFFGRIVFEREKWLDSSLGSSVWKYDFGISGGEIQPLPGQPAIVLDYTIDPDNQRTRGMDISSDTSSLVWTSTEYINDSWAIDINIVNLDDCAAWPCTTFNGGQSLIQTIYPPRGVEPWRMYIKQPVWGPYGDWVYFVAVEEEGEINSQFVRGIKSDGSDLGQATTIYGFENPPSGDPDYRHLRSVAGGLGGWPETGAFLAVEIGEDSFIHSCAELYTLDLEECPGSNCELQFETQGTFPSWTKTGNIAHSGLGNACKLDQIGLWDGVSVKTLAKGWEPEAAGGL
jgi:hypothetical protein